MACHGGAPAGARARNASGPQGFKAPRSGMADRGLLRLVAPLVAGLGRCRGVNQTPRAPIAGSSCPDGVLEDGFAAPVVVSDLIWMTLATHSSGMMLL